MSKTLGGTCGSSPDVRKKRVSQQRRLERNIRRFTSCTSWAYRLYSGSDSKSVHIEQPGHTSELSWTV